MVVADGGGVGPVPRGAVRLAEEVERAGARDVELLDVGAGADEDVVGIRVVGEGQDGALDRGEVGARVVGADVEGPRGAALEGVGRLLLALGKGRRRVGRRRVGVCPGRAGREGEGEAQGGEQRRGRGPVGGSGAEHCWDERRAPAGMDIYIYIYRLSLCVSPRTAGGQTADQPKTAGEAGEARGNAHKEEEEGQDKSFYPPAPLPARVMDRVLPRPSLRRASEVVCIPSSANRGCRVTGN